MCAQTDTEHRSTSPPQTRGKYSYYERKKCLHAGKAPTITDHHGSSFRIDFLKSTSWDPNVDVNQQSNSRSFTSGRVCSARGHMSLLFFFLLWMQLLVNYSNLNPINRCELWGQMDSNGVVLPEVGECTAGFHCRKASRVVLAIDLSTVM